MTALPEGIHLINKPFGVTSHDMVQVIRKKYNTRKVGHAGTLDPYATGLLVIGVDEGTKKLKDYVGANKTYIAEICIGEKSATGDAEGKIIEKKHVEHISVTNMEKALGSMIGILRLEVSIYSAMKKGGEELYKKARRGELVTPPMRDMEVFKASLMGEVRYKNGCAYADITFTVGSGAYVRSLAEELGSRLKYPARLENLKRVQVGDCKLEDAENI